MSLTIKDVQKLMQVFATKEDFNWLRERIEKIEERSDLILTILDKLDFLIGEVQTYRQEQAATSQRLEDVEEDNLKLDKRVKKIESLPAISSQLK